MEIQMSTFEASDHVIDLMDLGYRVKKIKDGDSSKYDTLINYARFTIKIESRLSHFHLFNEESRLLQKVKALIEKKLITITNTNLEGGLG